MDAEKRYHFRTLFNTQYSCDLGQEVTSTKSFNERMKTALYVVTGMFSVPRQPSCHTIQSSKGWKCLHIKGLKEADGTNILLKVKHIKALERNAPCSFERDENEFFFEHNTESFVKLRGKDICPLFAKDEFVGALYVLGKGFQALPIFGLKKCA